MLNVDWVKSAIKNRIRGNMRGYGREITSFRITALDNALLEHVSNFAQEKRAKGETLYVLDVGCATGHLAEKLARCGTNVVVYGVSPDDYSPDKIAERNKNLEKDGFNPIVLKAGMIQDLDRLFEGDNIQFDVVSLMNVLHFRPASELASDFRKIQQLLKSGGNLFFATHGGSKDDGMALVHGSGYDAPDQRRLVKATSPIFLHARLSGILTQPFIFHESGQLTEELVKAGFVIQSIQATSYKLGPWITFMKDPFHQHSEPRRNEHPWSLYVRAEQTWSALDRR